MAAGHRSPRLPDPALGIDVHRLDPLVPMASDGIVADPALDVDVPRMDLPCRGTGMLLR
ncbi:hypothetical protein M885DRAFT_573394 [Pelagophyceae sp. CCMP2097]|nr:hypothetical protein M885DRAFT_573394 [Pelagophyceae sp. CCMP2097]